MARLTQLLAVAVGEEAAIAMVQQIDLLVVQLGIAIVIAVPVTIPELQCHGGASLLGELAVEDGNATVHLGEGGLTHGVEGLNREG